VADDDGTDAARGTIAMTPRDATDASPFIRLASGISVSVHGGWVTSGCAMPTARVVDASSSTNRLSSIRFATDPATYVASSSSRAAINVDVTATANSSRATEDAFPMPVANCPPWMGSSSSAVSERAAPWLSWHYPRLTQAWWCLSAAVMSPGEQRSSSAPMLEE
jgi:hypothetical protein